MNEQFWHDRWKNKQTAFHTAEANPLLTRNLSFLNPRKGATVFVPLCGKSNDLHWLAEQGYRVIGAELSPLAVQQLFEESSKQPSIRPAGSLQLYEAGTLSIFQGSIFELTAEMTGPVDIVYDRAALVALPQEMRDRYAHQIRSLAAEARQLVICYEYNQTCDDGPPFSVTEDELLRLYREHFDCSLLERVAVAGGLKGKCPAVEAVWHLQPR